MTFFLTARCKNVYIADCTIVWNVLANTDNREIVSLGQGGGGYSTNFWEKVSCWWFETLPCSGQKNPYIHTLFRTTSSILWPCLGQNTRCLVLKPFIGNYNRANAHYINTVWKILRIMTFFLTARCKNVYIADCTIVWNVLANTDNREIVSLGQGGGGYSTNFWEKVSCWWFETLPCSGQKNPYIHTLFRTTSSILWPCLGQNTHCLVLKPFIGNCNRANAHYINTVCLLGSTSKVHQPNQINCACNTLFMI